MEEKLSEEEFSEVAEEISKEDTDESTLGKLKRGARSAGKTLSSAALTAQKGAEYLKKEIVKQNLPEKYRKAKIVAVDVAQKTGRLAQKTGKFAGKVAEKAAEIDRRISQVRRVEQGSYGQGMPLWAAGNKIYGTSKMSKKERKRQMKQIRKTAMSPRLPNIGPASDINSGLPNMFGNRKGKPPDFGF